MKGELERAEVYSPKDKNTYRKELEKLRVEKEKRNSFYEEFGKAKIEKERLGSGTNPCKNNREIVSVSNKVHNTIIWTTNFEIDDAGLSSLTHNNNIIRIMA